ncbi:MAG: M13 family metallopeptidase [Acidobacteria bacterium]|nr:M13 family metallopeptidase [Acidobacteriota bacterium]
MRPHAFRAAGLITLGLLFAAPPPKSGITPNEFDTACKPCDDFWRFVNGGWLDRNPIPASKSSWGTMSVVSEGNKERLRVLLETESSKKGSRVGGLYAACMDTARIETLDLKPIAARLERIQKIASREELKDTLTALFIDSPRGALVAVTASPDLKDTTSVVPYIHFGGLSLPDRDFYFRDDARSKLVRTEFATHAGRQLAAAGITVPNAGETLLAFETAVASVTPTNVERRDPYSRYNKKDIAGLEALAPEFQWRRALTGIGVPVTGSLIVSTPKVLEHFNRQIQEAPLETWKLWLQWSVLNNAAPHLPAVFATENFRFFSTVLNGTKEEQPRWQRCTELVDQAVGFELGRLYTAKHFPPAAKKRMNEMVENMRAALREEISKQNWLEDETRKNAIAKLNAFQAKIGYPDKWRDYSSVVIQPNALLESLRSAGLAARRYMLGKIGKPVDRTDWMMTPPTVNAYYSPPMNEIAFPAGILQPPMFDMEADDAVNYGAIGSVIGHEMGHGFDDQGSKFDFAGNLRNWWTSEDRKKFEARAQCVIEQFNTFDLGPGLRHNGRLVVGEALGDLGGVTLAHRAYQRSLRGKPAPPVIDGYTADQRFFIAFAKVWGTNLRPEAIRMRLQTDPHPIARYRANGTLMNIPEFHKAFGCKRGDAMVRDEDRQCKLW